MGYTHHRQVQRKEHQGIHSHVEEGMLDGRPWPRSSRVSAQKPNPKKNMVCMGYAGVDYNLNLCPLQSRLLTHLLWTTLCHSRP
jgi:hypothetical protein